jgi:hypothetical protein
VELARKYMIRLDREDFEDPEKLRPDRVGGNPDKEDHAATRGTSGRAINM